MSDKTFVEKFNKPLPDDAWTRHYEATSGQFDNDEISLGPWTSFSLVHDPKHLSFVLARYKFCAKMIKGLDRVVEVGCGDGFGAPLLAQEVGHLYCIDWDKRNIEGCKRRLKHLKNVTFIELDCNTSYADLQCDAAITVDVIEHLDPRQEESFMKNLLLMLNDQGFMLNGTPNITSEAYASKGSRDQHINLKSEATLRDFTLKYFQRQFSFGMNDEVLHTGYGPMCHYLWSLGLIRHPVSSSDQKFSSKEISYEQ